MFNKKIIITLLLTLFFTLFSCVETRVIKTILPLSKNVPTLIENNEEETWDLNLLEADNTKYLLYTVIDNAKGFADISYSQLTNIEPLKFTKTKLLLPKTNSKQRHLSSIIKIAGTYWIYYVEGDSLKDFSKSFRAQFSNGHLINVEQLNIKTTLRVIHWQKFHVLPNNKVVMVYRNGKGMFFGVSNDGKKFDNFIKVYERGAKPNILALNDDILIYAFQGGGKRKGTMQSKFSYSKNGGDTWSQAINTTESHGNVHDAFLLKRKDGKADIYYIYPIGAWRGFSLFRRCIKDDFTLGNEELLIEKEIGHLLKPNIFRLNGRQLLLTFIEASSNHVPFASIIYGDSVCP